MKTDAIIVAAGSGTRFGSAKQFAELNGMPLYHHALKTFAEHSFVEKIVLVISADSVTRIEKEIWPEFYGKKIEIAIGGETRQDSVANGMQKLEELGSVGNIIVHDAARPYIHPELITSVIEAIEKHGAALAAIPVVDTLKRSEEGFSAETISRKELWRAQTPQGAKFELLKQALEYAHAGNLSATDEAELLERNGVKPFIVLGNDANVKITFSHDLAKNL